MVARCDAMGFMYIFTYLTQTEPLARPPSSRGPYLVQFRVRRLFTAAVSAVCGFALEKAL